MEFTESVILRLKPKKEKGEEEHEDGKVPASSQIIRNISAIVGAAFTFILVLFFHRFSWNNRRLFLKQYLLKSCKYNCVYYFLI